MATKPGTTTESELAEYGLAKAVAKRDLYFSEVEELHRLSRSVETGDDASEFLTRFAGFADLREKLHHAVETVNDLRFRLNPNCQPEYETLRRADRLRCAIVAVAKRLDTPQGGVAAPSWAYKLPKISVPEFSGDLTQWPLFWEKFDAMIHRNPTLDDLAKLHYLLGALKGKASDVCAGITPTAANYPALLQTLKARYDNKRLLADHLAAQMLDAKPLFQESASGLSQILMRFDTAYKALLNLYLPDLADYLVTHLLLSKLDPLTRRAFETSKHEQIPTFAEVLTFLHSHVEALTQLPKFRQTPTRSTTTHPNAPSSSWKALVSQVAPLPETARHNNSDNKLPRKNPADTDGQRAMTCPICGQSHQIFRCDSFRKLSPCDRLRLAQTRKWCVNCLSHSHAVQACRSRLTCKTCHKAHHSLLHLDVADGHLPLAPEEPQSGREEPTSTFVTNSRPAATQCRQEEKIPLLPTALVLVQTPRGPRQARFLVDSGSQRNFVTGACCRELRMSYRSTIVPLEGMGSVPVQAIGVTQFSFSSMKQPAMKFQVSALVTERISHQLPPDAVQVAQLQFLQGLQLADESFFQPGRVDGILGAPIFGQILTGPALAGPDRAVHAVPTHLGHIIMGDAPKANVHTVKAPSPATTLCIMDNYSLHRAVQRFWELEEVPHHPKQTKEEEHCERRFHASTTRVEGGRYCVELPFREFPPVLGDSLPMAARRFASLERRFKKEPGFQNQYEAVLQDYLLQGHLTPVSVPATLDEAYPIPHFAVLKESSTTPLRIVFDASARTSNGRSLNDVLFPGPKLQQDLSHILIAFRSSAIALLADIRQMYRNILVSEHHRRYQQILWRSSPQEPLQRYQLNCVVFGVTSAPYLALRTVQQLATDEEAKFPLAAQMVRTHMYVDDLVVSVDSVPAALEAFTQLVEFFRAGGFKLTKWASNSPEVLAKIPAEERNVHGTDFADSSQPNEAIKVLGLTWDPQSDVFSFRHTPFSPTFTKRGILSIIARMWDPLGFLAPVTLLAKVLIKEVWSAGLDWDDELTPPLRVRWQQFMDELPHLHRLRVPRHFGTTSESSVMLIGFADSSEKGYGAVVYLRRNEERPEVSLVYAKSRVAPQKTVTLPKLELCAAVLLADIMRICLETLRPRFRTITPVALTDSTVTLAWIKNDCKRETFVANRVAAIERVLHPGSWYHVSSEDNIADVISRGLSPSQLACHDAWLPGPHWLAWEFQRWPIRAVIDRPASMEGVHTPQPPDQVVAVVVRPQDGEGIEPFLRRFSSLKRLLRVTVCLLRFGRRLPSRGDIDRAALDTAERVLIRQVQREHFEGELELLEKKRLCSSRLRPLSPFLEDGIIRVGGRLPRSTLPYESQHPILLPKRSHLSTLLITEYHESNLHTGPNLVCALVRQRFWILSARSAVRNIIRTCNFCFKKNPRPEYPPMADLPAARVQEAKPFVHTGVDYAGPFQITISRRRGVKSQKAYLCLFVCLATKAIHLELASSLSTDAFLACFKRFVARRGPVQCLYSDRGTNFIGAKSELDKVYNFVQSEAFVQPLTTLMNDRRIAWKFNPPLAPHFGGIWEANIRSVKTHLGKVVGSQILSYEEFNTLLVQVEALLNSRPLCSSSPDPAEPEALTPAHFLTLTPLRSLPLSDRVPSLPHSTRKALLDSIVRSFWDRWRMDYLTSLQHRRKWTSPTAPMEVGTVVVVKSDAASPLQWPLAVVEAVHPGPDGVVRVATIRMGKSTLQRPVAKLCPLPKQ